MKILHVFTIINTPKAFFDGQFAYIANNTNNELHLVTDSECDYQFCKKNNIVYHQIPIARSIAPLTDIKSVYKLIKLIKREKIEAVVGHTPKGAMVAMIAAKMAGVKKRIYYRHGLIYTSAKGLKRNLFKNVERLTASFATHIINVSPSLSDLAIKDKLNSSKKQRVIGEGTCGGIDTNNIFNPANIDESKLSMLRYSQGLNDSKLVVGFCGRICKDKGIRELIDGFKLFRKAYPQINPKLLLVGNYDKRDVLPDDYKDIIESDDDIVYTGHITKKMLPYYYSLMDVFVFPSYREGFGMSVIEAAAMNVPALVSRSHGCIDSILEDKTGKYIDISPEGVIEGLEKIMDSSTRKSLGQSARKYVEENFDSSILWPMILDFYSEIQN